MKISFVTIRAVMRSKLTWLRVLTLLSISFLLLFFLFVVITALQHSYTMDTYAANGTFQLYNPLTRLAQGEVPGHNFPFFHGVGVLFLHLPLFTALGENVFAAEM